MICMITHNMVYNFNNKIWNQWFLSGLSYTDTYLYWFHRNIKSWGEKWFSDINGCFTAQWSWDSFYHCWFLVAIVFTCIWFQPKILNRFDFYRYISSTFNWFTFYCWLTAFQVLSQEEGQLHWKTTFPWCGAGGTVNLTSLLGLLP